MKVLLLYSHDDSRMGHQHEKRLIDVFVGETDNECKTKVEQKYKKPLEKVIADWCSYEIREAD